MKILLLLAQSMALLGNLPGLRAQDAAQAPPTERQVDYNSLYSNGRDLIKYLPGYFDGDKLFLMPLMSLMPSVPKPTNFPYKPVEEILHHMRTNQHNEKDRQRPPSHSATNTEVIYRNLQQTAPQTFPQPQSENQERSSQQAHFNQGPGEDAKNEEGFRPIAPPQQWEPRSSNFGRSYGQGPSHQTNNNLENGGNVVFQVPFKPSQFLGYSNDTKESNNNNNRQTLEASKQQQQHHHPQEGAINEPFRSMVQDWTSVALGKYFNQHIKPIHEEQGDSNAAPAEGPLNAEDIKPQFPYMPNSIYALFRSRNKK